MDDVNDNNTGLDYSVLNYSIDRLREIEDISIRACNACKGAGLNNLKDVIDFFKKNRTFITIKDCGDKTNNELLILCSKYENHLIKSDSLGNKTNIKECKNFTIEELIRIENLSVRVLLICIRAGFNNLEDIIEYYKKNNQFLSLKSCGIKTNKELIKLCGKYEDNIINPNNFEEKIIINLNEYINYTLDELKNLETISERACNVCKRAGLNNLEEIINFFEKYKSFLRIRNCGKKTDNQLKKICRKYNNMISTINETDLIYLSIINKISMSSNINISDYIIDFSEYCKNKNIPLLKILEVVLFNGKYFDNVDKNIINNIYQCERRTLQEIGVVNGLTRERIRQRRNRIQEIIFHKYGVVSNITKTLLDFSNKEDLLLKDDLFIVGTSFTDKINSDNGTNFGIEFIGNILALCNPDYNIISNHKHRKYFYLLKNIYKLGYVINFIEYLESIINKRRHKDIIIKWKDVLSINVSDYKKDYLKLEDFKKELIEKLYVLLEDKKLQGVKNSKGKTYFNKNKKITKTILCKINFNDLLNYDWTYIPEINNKIKNKIDEYRNKEKKTRVTYEKKTKREKNKLNNKSTEYLSIFKVIAKNEFNLQIDDDIFLLKQNIFESDYILKKRNTIKTRQESIINILNKFDRPMHVSELFAELSKTKPELFPKELSLKNDLWKSKEVISFGRMSNFGLKKWENEKENMKGGTIRKIVEEYLRNEKIPKHIADITNYVNKYRNTNRNSVRSNLRVSKTYTFKFYENGNIGLSNENIK